MNTALRDRLLADLDAREAATGLRRDLVVAGPQGGHSDGQSTITYDEELASFKTEDGS